ncbi:hypothetical protein DYB28_008028 [Aphanomyces astaci]|uniref:Uncharacterized protein n=1 Tax=Aphanomyces astaci TaxID=112090 RepID=A0A397ETF6_APHAT|nr:hypothetical protein DYB31_014480 [Aphanomyces astaci]RHZ39012.1 hypothetical protein DYB26_013853 [Aphanomyces astaci]RLO03563.1 hypothetical protein DYB28_008028 [Aphanomyces astaci]
MTSALTSSLLTAGCKDIPKKTSVIGDLVKEILAVEVQMQDAHVVAKQDPDKGEQVLDLYVRFLERRDLLIAQLQKEGMAVPWQLRVKIDEFEQTLKERKKLSANKSASLFSTTDDERSPQTTPTDSVDGPSSVSETASVIAGVLPLVVSLLVVGIAVYLAANYAQFDLLK